VSVHSRSGFDLLTVRKVKIAFILLLMCVGAFERGASYANWSLATHLTVRLPDTISGPGGEELKTLGPSWFDPIGRRVCSFTSTESKGVPRLFPAFACWHPPTYQSHSLHKCPGDASSGLRDVALEGNALFLLLGGFRVWQVNLADLSCAEYWLHFPTVTPPKVTRILPVSPSEAYLLGHVLLSGSEEREWPALVYKADFAQALSLASPHGHGQTKPVSRGQFLVSPDPVRLPTEAGTFIQESYHGDAVMGWVGSERLLVAVRSRGGALGVKGLALGRRIRLTNELVIGKQGELCSGQEPVAWLAFSARGYVILSYRCDGDPIAHESAGLLLLRRPNLQQDGFLNITGALRSMGCDALSRRWALNQPLFIDGYWTWHCRDTIAVFALRRALRR